MTDTHLNFPEKGLIDRDDYSLYTTRRPSVVLAIEREVVNPILIRNNETEQAETQTINGTTRAQANPEKFTTKERLTGLDALRQFDEGADLIEDTYRHNEYPALDEAINMDSITYGATGTGDQNYSMKSRLMTGYTYTVDEYDIIGSETRNQAHESGTMHDESMGDGNGNSQSSALYEVTPIQPGNSFVQFQTIEAPTPGMVAYVLHNVLNTQAYGARETRTGKTINNSVRAVIFSDQTALLSAGEFLQTEDPSTDTVSEALGSYIESAERAHWDVYTDGTVTAYPDYPDWLATLLDTAARRDEGSADTLREEFLADTQAAQDAIINN